MTGEETIFAAAVAHASPADRAAYLDRARADDPGLRRDVDALLAAHDRAQGILEALPVGVAGTAPDRAPPDAAGTTVGPYKLLEQIGGGGMGVVYMAEQLRPVRRKVALKIIRPGMDSGQVIARFEAERQALTMMDHPNIAKVLDAGTTDAGRPYFVMELVKGVPITDYCDQARLTTPQRLGLFIQVCQAVQHAHQKGVIHRDLKPGNVLVTLHDDKPVPKVIDFGIAKATGHVLTDRTLFTHFTQMLGTPLYMSPEQALLSGHDVDTRSDVYSLGVLLYELLTGTTPFDRRRLGEAAYDEMRRIIREEDPPRPSTRLSTLGGDRLTAVSAHRQTDPKRLGQLVRGELDWIVMRALEKDRTRRYESPNALAADVRRHLRNEAVLACPPSAAYRFRKFAGRRKAALAVASAFTVAVLLAVAALAASAVLVWRANDGLKKSLARETQSLARERTEANHQRILVAHRELSFSDNLVGALRTLDECPDDLRPWEWHYLKRLCRVEPLVIRDGGGEVSSVAFSRDGQRLASAGADGAVKIWDARTGRLVRRIDAHAGRAFSVAFHPDGDHVASTGADRRVKVWRLGDDRPVFSGACGPQHQFGAAYAVAFSPDGDRVVAGGDGALRAWDWRKHELVHTLPNGEARAPTVAYSGDGRWLATGTWGGTVKILDAGNWGNVIRGFPDDANPVTAVAFSPDGSRLARTGSGRRVHVLDTATGAPLLALPHTGLIACVAFSPDGRRIASGGEDKTVRLWDAATGREVLGLRGHTGACLCVTFTPDGRRLASAGADGTIHIWDGTPLRGGEGQETATFAAHRAEVWRVAVSPDPAGRRVASAGLRTPAMVWDAPTGKVAAEFRGHPFVTFDVAWRPDGQQIASAGFDGTQFTVKAWDARTGREAFKIAAPSEWFTVAYSPDGRHLVTGGMTGEIQVWDAATGQFVVTLGTHESQVRGITFSRDGRHLASTAGDGDVRLWDATRLAQPQQPRRAFRGRGVGHCLNLAFSADGNRLASGGEENTVKVWDVDTGAELLTLRGHTADVYAVAFSPAAGRWIASAGEDSTVRIWDARTGRRVRTFRGHEALVGSLAFSPDGAVLYSGSRDQTVKSWDMKQLDAAVPPPAP